MKRSIAVGTVLLAFGLAVIFIPRRSASPFASVPVVDSIFVDHAATTSAIANGAAAISPPPTPSELPAPSVAASHPAWPGAKVLAMRASPPLDGLITRVTLLQPTNFPYAVYVEEKLNGFDAPDEQRIVRRFEAVASHFLVKLRDGQTLEMLTAIARQFGGCVRLHPTAGRLYFVDLPQLEPDGVSRAQAILSQYPEIIEYAEPDAIVRAAATTPDDPRFAADQWGLNNTGQSGGTADVDIDAPEAWDIRREATNLIVAVVDSGIRYTHEDIATNMWRNAGEIAANGIDDDGNGFVDDVYGINAITDTGDPTDDLFDPVLGIGGHGTSVAGVIGAAGNNGKGISGIAWKVRLMALKWFNNQGAGALSDAIQCMDYARTNGAAIVNASWQQGGLLSGTVNQSMMDALQRLRQAGIIFVSSAGNDTANNDLVAHYPSNYPFDNMVAVAAGTHGGLLWRQSNFGERLVDVVAPGENILAPTSKADNDYSIVSGTSFAAPHVSGMLAILKAQFPAENYHALINRLLAGAERSDRLSGKVRSGAFANLFRSLTLAAVPEFPEITNFTMNGAPVASQAEVSVVQGTNVTLAVAATGNQPLTYSWKRDAKAINGATAASYSIPSFAAGDIGDYQVAVSNAAGVVTVSLRLLGVVVKPELAAAVNATNRIFLSSGNVLWDSQNTVTRDGVSAGVSGRIAARQNTLASTIVNGPGKASFAWKVSSERDNDTLDLLIDNVRVDSISGEADWARKEYAISAGAHELRWRYVKDASLSKGDDKGYLDQFQFEADALSAPAITSQPASQTVLQGSGLFFSVLATGSAPLSYQWLKDGTNVASAQSNRLDLVNVTPANEGRYSVIVSNTAGFVSSANARLTVTPAPTVPRVVTHPVSQTADEGATVTFTVGVNGTPPLQFQWRKNTQPITGKTNATLTLTNLALADSGTYSATATNAAGGDISHNATLTVVQLQLAPTITKQPVGETVNAGESIGLTVEAGGLGPFNYEWRKDGQVLTNEVQPDLIRSNAQPADAGSYQVRVNSPFGSTLSEVALIKVNVFTPSLAQAISDTNFIWNTDGDAVWFRQTAVTFDGVDALQSGDVGDLQFSELIATATGPGQISFWWKVSSEFGYDTLGFYVDYELVDSISGDWGWEEVIWNIPEGEHTLIWFYAKDETLSVGADAGWLDEVSFVSFNTESPVVVRHPVNQSSIEGGEATFEIEAVGSPFLTYHWFKDNEPLSTTAGASLTVGNLSTANEGFYHVIVSNQFGHAESRVAYLYVFDESDLVDYALNFPGLNWTDFGSVPWFAQIQETADGEIAMQSGPIGNDGVSWLGTAVAGPGILYYSWKVSSEENYDFLEFLVDGFLWDYISGEVNWRDNSVVIPPGVHYPEWVYFKDETVSSGADAGWLDWVLFVPLSPFDYWKNIYFTADDLLDPQISGDQADPDLDGFANAVEYAFGLNPSISGDADRPTGQLETRPEGTFFVLVYYRRTNDPNLSYQREVSSNLSDWTPILPASWNETTTTVSDDLEEVRARYLTPITADTKFFCRVKLTVGP